MSMLPRQPRPHSTALARRPAVRGDARRPKRLRAANALLLILLFSGIFGCARRSGLPIDESIFPDGGRHYRDYRILGWSREGRPIVGYVFGRGEEKVIIVSGQHGDAPSGPALLDRLVTHLIDHPDYLADRTVIVVPRLNPDGLAVNRRGNLLGVDLDRNMPTPDWRRYGKTGCEAASEPETRALLFLFRRIIPSRLLVIRAPLNQVMALGDIDYYVAELLRDTDYAPAPPTKRSPSGSLATMARQAGWPTIIWDLSEREPWPEIWDELGEGLLGFVGSPRPILPR